MKHLKTYEFFNSILPEPVEFTKNDKIAEKIVDSNANVYFKIKYNFPEVYFEIENIGKMMLNYEWFDTKKSFVESHKTLEDMVYWWEDLNDKTLNGKYIITEILSEYILDKLKT